MKATGLLTIIHINIFGVRSNLLKSSTLNSTQKACFIQQNFKGVYVTLYIGFCLYRLFLKAVK